jgi:hypothetical protein
LLNAIAAMTSSTAQPSSGLEQVLVILREHQEEWRHRSRPGHSNQCRKQLWIPLYELFQGFADGACCILKAAAASRMSLR